MRLPPNAAPPPSYPEATVVQNYDANTATELTIRVGDRVQVIQDHPSGWSEVTRMQPPGRGWIPSTFIRK